VAIAGVPPLRLDAGVEAAVYYLVAESLTNAARHADATEARVEIATTDAEVVVEIGDDGGGGAGMGRGSGLRGLADRVEALGGQFDLKSPSGGGTVVRATLPLH
jgi:signal transduction histidine kinase